MSVPRPVIAGQTVMVSRRCTQRQFLCRPGREVNGILGFCLAVAAARYGIVLHAYCFLSNHVHLILTDVRGNQPEFFRWFFEFTAKCLNAHWGRWENLWAAERPSVVRLVDAEAQLEKAVYVITNPVEANLVTSAHRWPGLISLPSTVGKERVFKRPKGFFRENGPLAEQATLRTEPLPEYADLELDAFIALLAQAVADKEAELAERRREEGKSVLGRRAVLRQSPFDRPSSHEPRRQLNPRVASRHKWARIEALCRLKAFLESYKDAWQRWRDGQRDVLFPYGTYALRLRAGVHCLGPP